MKCKVKAGALQAAIQMAKITMDRRPTSELSALYISAKKNKDGLERLVLHTSDSISRTMIRVLCSVEGTGSLVVDPVRLLAVLEGRQPDDIVSFSAEMKAQAPTGRVQLKVGQGRVQLSSAEARIPAFESSMALFPGNLPPLFSIESNNLKLLLDRTSDFTYQGDGRENFKAVLIRSIDGGYEALASNGFVSARATVEDQESPGAGAKVRLEIPNHALESLSRMLNRNRSTMVRVMAVMQPGETEPRSIFFRTDDVFYGTLAKSTRLPEMDAHFTLTQILSEVDVSRAGMLASLQRSHPYCSAGSDGKTVMGLVGLLIKGSTLRVSAHDTIGDFEELLPIKGVGEASATFSVGFVSDILRKASQEEVHLSFGELPPLSERKRPVAMIQEGGNNGASYVVGVASQ